MRRGYCILIVGACVASFLLGPVVRPARANVDPKAVDEAIDKGKKYIYSKMQNGNWEVAPQPRYQYGKGDQWQPRDWQWGGVSSIAICSLLYAGEDHQSKQLKPAIEWLRRAEVYGIYAMGFRCQIWGMLPQNKENRAVAVQDMKYLLQAVHFPKPGAQPDPKKQPITGLFPYYFYDGRRGGGEDWYDHSVSQYGVLGMWACAQQEIEVSDAFWQAVEAAWIAGQNEDGGWGYKRRADDKNSNPSVAMTAAGLATLFITQDMIHAGEGLKCTGNIHNQNIERAIAWMHKNFRSFEQAYPHYALYGVERIGVASGHKYFGDLDWYQVGAEWLLRHQKDDGAWGNSDDHNPNSVPDTAMALMFLARGGAPVMMNKLEYGAAVKSGDAKNGAVVAYNGAWNERPRDVANITRWVGRGPMGLEQDLNWQIVNLQRPANELHDAPLLWISGKEAMSFSAEDVAKLKQYVEQGGIIIGNADCGAKEFAESFRKLGQTMFPAYEFRELDSKHSIYTEQQFKIRNPPPAPFLQALDNDARVLMLLFPNKDPAQGYQQRSFAGGVRQPMAEVMSDIFLYAMDMKTKELRDKGDTYLVERNGNVTAGRSVKIARLDYGGNWDPEPAGWRRLANVMHNHRKIDIQVETVKLGTGKLTALAYPVAHMTGTRTIKYDPKDESDVRKYAEIKKYVEDGGTLIVDAAGGAMEFIAGSKKPNTGVEWLLQNLLPKAQSSALPLKHPMFACGEKIASVQYRVHTRKVATGLRGPNIHGIDINGKTRVFTSSEDLSVGLVGNPIGGIAGYEPKSATALMANMIEYATSKDVPATAPAATKK